MKSFGIVIACVLAFSACGKSHNPKIKEAQAQVDAELAKLDTAEGENTDETVETTTAPPVAQNEEPSGQPKVEPVVKPTVETKSDSKAQPKAEPKVEAKAPEKAAPKANPAPKVAAKVVPNATTKPSKNLSVCSEKGADLLKRQQQFSKANVLIAADLKKAREARDRNDALGMLAGLKAADRTLDATISSCVEFKAKHAVTAQLCRGSSTAELAKNTNIACNKAYAGSKSVNKSIAQTQAKLQEQKQTVAKK